jgi:peptidoglycan/xylan/chitin deacetylase (PgdA/CDA1 family)
MRPRVLFGVDVETDVGSFTPFYEGARRGVPFLLDLFRRAAVDATFFFTGDAARENPSVARAVAESGQEVGCHSLYHETLGDELFPIPNVKPMLPEEAAGRIRTSTEWVREASGCRPVSFRCPRLWGSTRVVRVLEDLGYVSDASYPMYFHRNRLSPYHPSAEDWREEGSLRILEIPNFADMAMRSADPPLERDRDQWPLFRTGDGKGIDRCIDGYLAAASKRGAPPVLCFYIHPWEFVPMEERYDFGECTVIPNGFITENCGDTARRRLEALVGRLRDRGYVFTSARGLAGNWETIREEN